MTQREAFARNRARETELGGGVAVEVVRIRRMRAAEVAKETRGCTKRRIHADKTHGEERGGGGETRGGVTGRIRLIPADEGARGLHTRRDICGTVVVPHGCSRCGARGEADAAYARMRRTRGRRELLVGYAYCRPICFGDAARGGGLAARAGGALDHQREMAYVL